MYDATEMQLANVVASARSIASAATVHLFWVSKHGGTTAYATLRKSFVAVLVCASMMCPAVAEPPVPPPPTLTGKVVDPSRTPVPGAVIIATKEGSVAPVATSSGQAGEFGLSLSPGTYTLRIAADGFQDNTRTLEMTGAQASVEAVLSLADRKDVVTVTESATYQVITSNSTRTATPLVDIPQSITVITSDLIRNQAMQNMADVVRYVPGITMAQGEGHRDAPVIRGNATTADFYIDGVRDDVQYYRDVYNVERVEAVKGANALTFGRGGGGGVINRVSKQARFAPLREISMQGGMFGHKRFTTDLGHDFSDRLSFRLNGLYDNSDSFRHDVSAERYGIAPTLTLRASDRTSVRAAYERFHDDRTVDRGIPSYKGIPSGAHRSTFFGDPDNSFATAGVHLGTAAIDHQIGVFNVRNTTTVGDYDKFYQNIFPGAVNAGQTLVALSAYNNQTFRRNFFNQTDVAGVVYTGGLRHTFLVGTEFGRQRSDNFRNTGYFGSATSFNVPFASPRISGGVAFRQSATDADNYAINNIGAVYVQDQLELSRYVQIVAGVRYDSFNIDFHNNRTNENLSRDDNMVSPRAGLILKPLASLSLYSGYSVSYLPSSGDQFSSLTATTQTLKPEKFRNYEFGAKWDVHRSLSFTTAAYRLDRTNTTARDPNDPSRTVQTGSQRTNGYELGVNGNLLRRWRVAGGYACQDAFVSSATTAAPRGAKVALVPNHTFSLWNDFRMSSRLSSGLGLIYQAAMFAGIDNTVRLPSFARADLAVFYTLTEKIRLQVNVENLFDRTYYPTAHGNNNIMPGYARTARVGLTTRF
jgi:catecholate siderophore receptor